MSNVAGYVLRLLDVFIKWWWAAATGVASIASWWAFPTGFSLSRLEGVFFIFAVLTLMLLVVSVLFQGYRWYVATETHPEVQAFIPRGAAISAPVDVPAPGVPSVSEPLCSFLVRERGWRMAPGYIFGLYRSIEHNEEVCIAVLRVERARFGDDSVQCASIWISPIHLKALNDDRELAKKLVVRREIPDRTIAEVARLQQ